MTPELSKRLHYLISTRTGLHIRPRDRETFQAALVARVRALKLSGPQEYCLLLESGSSLAEREWPEFAARLTNRESYFFRDTGQMALLRDQILPELIEKNRARRSLRLWSAGCSTGEEPYSLAILLDQLLPPREEWQVVILGTDLNPKTLADAERGVFGAWSFRTLEPAMRQRYFRPTRDGWEIADTVRRPVTFFPSNLTHDLFPDPDTGLHDMDLILCRNVFIYFERHAIPPVVCKLANTLREGGYLMTGHAEIEPPYTGGLQARRFPGSQVYQRKSHAPPADVTPPRSVPALPIVPQIAQPLGRGRAVSEPNEPPVSPAPESPDLEFAGDGRPRVELAQGNYEALVARLEPLMAQQPADHAALYLLAQAHTNRGRQELAVDVCRQASERDPLAAAPYQVLAALAEDQGDHEEAKRLLKQVIYLAPATAVAYVELGALYAREGERARARRMWTTAHELLLGLPADTTMAPWDGPLAGEWLRHVEVQLADAD